MGNLLSPQIHFFFSCSVSSSNRGSAMRADLAWDDGGEYARAAEAAGVDVGGMLEAGVDAKHLLEFVSNYRKEEGEVR